ncbi:MAG: hypothetical protein K6L76_12445 [Agarilytica sp.]
MYKILTVCSLSFALLACANQNLTEAQKYEKLQNSLKYDSYRKLSKTGIGAIVDTYNHVAEKEDKQQATKPYVFAMSSFIWLMAMQPDFAIADANTARRKKASDKARYVALATQSMAFYQKGWSGLAEGYSQEAKTLMAAGNINETYENEQQLAYLVLGGLAIYNGDSVLAQNSFQGLGESVGKPWLADLARIAVGLKEGTLSESLRIIRGLRNNENLSDSERMLFTRLNKSLSKQQESGGIKRNTLNRQITNIAFQAVLDSENESIAALGNKIKKFQNKIDL